MTTVQYQQQTGSGPAAPPLVARGGVPVSVVHLTAEYYPYARTGGLAEAVGCLAAFQQRAGLEVTVIMPLYPTVREAAPDLEPVGEPFPVPVGARLEEARLFRLSAPPPGPRVFFVEHRGYFDRPGIYGEGAVDYPDNHRRFALLSMAAALALPRITPLPCVLHAHDWHTALAPVYLRSVLAREPWAAQTAAVLSVHNPGYQGHFAPDVMADVGLPWELFNWQQLEWYGQVNFLKGGLVFSDQVVTVSPTQAAELRTPDGGFGLHQVFDWLGDRFCGILNGIDQGLWDPTTDDQITARYTRDELEGKRRCKTALQRSFGLPQRRRTPLLGLTGRLVGQKGLDLILGDPDLLALGAQFVFLGTGEKRYERALVELAAAAPDRVAVQLDFSDRLEHRLMAGCDLFLMPSLYEPCGLTQMRAQRYGALPVGRRVGGLADTIEDGVTGFLFDAYSPAAFHQAAAGALAAFADADRWTGMMREAMARDFSWERSTGRYLEVYRQATALALR
ncbi:MAG TPA: glycogen/starch synthase [Gemmatimonadales bacterium]|nr:glycogen/starch synthase [Gemmatimonadales bacterium]